MRAASRAGVPDLPLRGSCCTVLLQVYMPGQNVSTLCRAPGKVSPLATAEVNNAHAMATRRAALSQVRHAAQLGVRQPSGRECKPKQLMFRMPACDGGHQRMFSGQRGLRLDMHTAPRYHMSNSLLCEMCAEPHTETAPYSPCWHRRSDTLYNLRVARAPLSVLNMWAARAAPRKCLINGRHNVRPSCM